jgi:hypothetical protein
MEQRQLKTNFIKAYKNGKAEIGREMATWTTKTDSIGRKTRQQKHYNPNVLNMKIM